MLREFCSVCNYADDGFIGIRYRDGRPHVSFPRGYSLSNEDEAVRKDILCLIAVLQRFSRQREGDGRTGAGEETLSFPILSYQYVINDFLAHGYYAEQEVEYRQSDSGKVNWKRTIQQVQPQLDNGNIVYLNFIAKRSVTASSIITRIHEFCVYESFSKLGWLYLSSAFLPPKPSFRFNRRIYLSALNDALKNTFNSEKKLLFKSMINIVNCAEEHSERIEFQYGVSRFEYVWENLIDYVFGESNKDVFFPHAKWHIINGHRTETSALEPDTVMLLGDKLFILDAKYYKYGITNNPMHLPATSSIQKQITYGDYIARCHFVGRNEIYNAFVMPFTASDGEDPMKFVSVGTADWIEYSPRTENYKYILGMLLDTRYIMNTYTRHNEKEILNASELIVKSLEKYRLDEEHASTYP